MNNITVDGTPHHVVADTVNEALRDGLSTVFEHGMKEETRNGPAYVLQAPLISVYRCPEHRVLFYPGRDANPFFHLVEALWMLSGSNEIALPVAYASNMKNFSADGKTFHAAYGHRWRSQFEVDQLIAVVEKLRASPGTRQAVLQIWDARVDLLDTAENAKDRACNLSAVFTRRQRGNRFVLDMMVSNRSNDLVWGAYGANQVHFGILHEFVCQAVGIEVGVYTQVSANAHVYTDQLYGQKLWNNLVQTSSEVEYPDPLLNVWMEPGYAGASIYNEYIGEQRCGSVEGGFSSPSDQYAEHLQNLQHFLRGLLRLSTMLNDKQIRSFVRDDLRLRSGQTFRICQEVMLPMAVAYQLHKIGRPEDALRELELHDHYVSTHLKIKYLNDYRMGIDQQWGNPVGPRYDRRWYPSEASRLAVDRSRSMNIDWFRAGAQWIARRMKDPAPTNPAA